MAAAAAAAMGVQAGQWVLSSLRFCCRRHRRCYRRCHRRCHRRCYRADWEPEAPSGKCMAGVPGVFWRCPAASQGPSTHNPAWVPGKTHTSKNWPIFPICMWKWGGSAPSGQARVSRPNWPQCAKSHAAWQSLSSRAEKLRIFSQNIFSFFDQNFFQFLVNFFAVFSLLAIF